MYLDQWVWIRLAQVLSGKSDNAHDKRALERVISASDAGVIFPISVTHYIETFKISDGDRRRFLAAVMIRASKCRTLRMRKDLLRSQMLNAMHELFERPTFCQRSSKTEPKRSPKTEPVRCHYSSTAPRVTDARLVSPESRSR